jgi:hypothetical protein
MTTTFGNSFGISPFIAGVSNGGFSITDITNNVQRLIIQDSTGNVGIGTTSPANTLHVAGVGRIDTGLYFVNGGTGGAFVWNIANESLRFGTNDTERMRITSGGNVGIGVSPDVRLDVLGTSDTSDVVRIRKSSTGSIRGALGTQSGVGYLDLYNDSSTLNIRLLADGSSYFNGGNVGIGTTSPGTTLQVDASKSNTTVSAPFNSDIIRLNNTNATTNALHGILLTRTNGASLISVGAIMSQVTTQTVGSAAADLLFYTATSDVISERMRITSGGNVGIGTTPSYRLHVVTDAVAGKQNMSNISRTTGNWVRFTNPQFSTDSSMGLILKSFPDSDGRQGAGIIASGGSNNASTDLDLFVTTSPDGSGGTSYSAIKINGFNGNVGIGTTDPSRLLHILAPTGNHAYQRIEGGSGGYGGFLELMANSVGSGTDSAGRIDFYMTSTNRIATIDAQRISAAANYGTLIFSTADNSTTPTERMRITSDGYVRLTSSSGGIQFNGDTAAANALDDYEEGTWTPVFTGCTFTGTYTATYTKIGRKVTVQLSFINQSISSVTGNAQIGGLPFTSTNVYQAGSITYADILTTAGSVYVQNNNTNLYFLQNTGTTAADWNAGTNSRSLMLTATYFV